MFLKLTFSVQWTKTEIGSSHHLYKIGKNTSLALKTKKQPNAKHVHAKVLGNGVRYAYY